MAEFIHHVTNEDDGLQVYEILRNYFDFSSRLRTRIKRDKLVTLNGEETKGWYKVHPGDVVQVNLPEERSDFEPENIPLNPIFEDEDLLLINKQPGLIVHPTKGNPSGTAANALMYRMEQTGEHFKIRFVNRLDRDTSGIFIVAKNSYSQNEITKQMKSNQTEKKYIAILEGIIEEDNGTVNVPIGRPDLDDVRRGVMMEDGYPSITHFTVLERIPSRRLPIEYGLEGENPPDGYTVVQLVLETGRTHQIRVHMAHIGHPVLSDHLYGVERPMLIDRQALHAAELTFTHPAKGEKVHVEAPIPEDMNKALAKLR
ncbi:MAG: RluA family pseudouridine synthase [Eubacterium sp.]|nr:RluA family pseudouridine synthase [Candidatus Colimonas fimequi]